MKQQFIAGLCLWAFVTITPALAGDPSSEQCLECHEPAEDWSGMSIKEIMVQAKNPDNKRHAQNEAISDEQLKVILAELLPES